MFDHILADTLAETNVNAEGTSSVLNDLLSILLSREGGLTALMFLSVVALTGCEPEPTEVNVAKTHYVEFEGWTYEVADEPELSEQTEHLSINEILERRAFVDTGITKIDEMHFSIWSDLFEDRILNNKHLGEFGRAIPHRAPDGYFDGYRLSGIRRGTFGEKIGLRNGDIVHFMNGVDCLPENKMRLMEMLATSTSVKVQLTRRGVFTTLVIDIVE